MTLSLPFHPAERVGNVLDGRLQGVAPHGLSRLEVVQAVPISSKIQVVIPKAIRETLQLTPGQKVQVILHEGRIELIPMRLVKQIRGFLSGREPSDREK